MQPVCSKLLISRFRTLSARQKLRFDQNMLALEDGADFDVAKYDTVWSTKFKNGEIVDESLLNWAKTDTFQEDLTGNMAKLADLINSFPPAKFFIPFVKTPTNIIKQSFQYTPFVNRFLTDYNQVMKGSDEAMKAVYRGREASGYMIGITSIAMGHQGLLTGAGPADPNKRKIWEEIGGNQAHSIRFGNQWVSTRFLGPIGILLSAYADMGMLAANAGSYDTYEERFSQLMYTTAGSFTDQSFLKVCSLLLMPSIRLSTALRLVLSLKSGQQTLHGL